MKKITLILCVCLSTITASFAQLKWPDCSHLTVTNIVMDNDTPDLMKITIYNSCDTCNSGINGPVYLNLRMVRTVSPFDTIADCKCYNFWTPPNQGSQTYAIHSNQTSVPAFGTYMVQLTFYVCDDITISQAVGIAEEKTDLSFMIYPNPATDKIYIGTDAYSEIKITGIHGNIIYESATALESQSIDLSSWAPGIYFINLWDNCRLVAVKRIIKE